MVHLLIFDFTWFCFSFLDLFLVFDSVEAAGMCRQFFYFTWRHVVVFFNTVVVVALQAKIQLRISELSDFLLVKLVCDWYLLMYNLTAVKMIYIIVINNVFPIDGKEKCLYKILFFWKLVIGSVVVRRTQIFSFLSHLCHW